MRGKRIYEIKSLSPLELPRFVFYNQQSIYSEDAGPTWSVCE
jgi:hypothetical protein